MNLTVDGERLRKDIERNAAFGDVDAETGRGRTVLAGSQANERARDALVTRFEETGLDVRIDAVGNILGRWRPSSVDPDVSPVATGSHLDSVPEGGIFDGPLGVYAGLEAVRTLQDAGFEPDRPIDVVSFTEEEGGRFSSGLLGSSVAVGERSVEQARALMDEQGRTVDAALEEIGYRGDGVVDAGSWDAWLELHIEQSDRLEDAGISTGAVTAITGINHCEARIIGEANHAGATPMGERTDALAAASEFVLDVESAAKEATAESETAVGTVGSLDVQPNATNVVPGAVELGVDVRDVDHSVMDTIVERATQSLARLERERNVETEFERPFDLEPVPMSDRCRDAIHAAGANSAIETMDIHSGAAHDSMHVAKVTDAGMLFAPSRYGISHNPREWTDWEECRRATRVLTGALAKLTAQ